MTLVPMIEIANIHVFYRIQILTHTKLIGNGAGEIAHQYSQRQHNFLQSVYGTSNLLLLVLNPLMASLVEVVLKL